VSFARAQLWWASDLTDAQWELIKDLIPVACNIKIDRRLLINAVFYLTKTGCQWSEWGEEEMPGVHFCNYARKKYMGKDNGQISALFARKA